METLQTLARAAAGRPTAVHRPISWVSNVERIGSRLLLPSNPTTAIQPGQDDLESTLEWQERRPWSWIVETLARSALGKRWFQPETVSANYHNHLLDPRLSLGDVAAVSTKAKTLLKPQQIDAIAKDLDRRLEGVTAGDIVQVIKSELVHKDNNNINSGGNGNGSKEVTLNDLRVHIGSSISHVLEPTKGTEQHEFTDKTAQIAAIVASILEQTQRRGNSVEYADGLAREVLKMCRPHGRSSPAGNAAKRKTGDDESNELVSPLDAATKAELIDIELSRETVKTPFTETKPNKNPVSPFMDINNLLAKKKLKNGENAGSFSSSKTPTVADLNSVDTEKLSRSLANESKPPPATNPTATSGSRIQKKLKGDTLVEYNAGEILNKESERACIIALALRTVLAFNTLKGSSHLILAAANLARTNVKEAHRIYRDLIATGIPGSAIAYFNFLNLYHGASVPSHVNLESSTLYTQFKPQRFLNPTSEVQDTASKNEKDGKTKTKTNIKKGNADPLKIKVVEKTSTTKPSQSTKPTSNKIDLHDMIRSELLLVENLSKWGKMRGSTMTDSKRDYGSDYWSSRFPVVGDILGDMVGIQDVSYTMTNYTIAAAKGVPSAQYKLGRILLDHYTVSALLHFKQSAMQGYIPSLEALVHITSRPQPVYHASKLIGKLDPYVEANRHYSQILDRKRRLLAQDDTRYLS